MWRQITIGESSADTFCLDCDGESALYLNICPSLPRRELLREKERLDWLQGRLPVRGPVGAGDSRSETLRHGRRTDLSSCSEDAPTRVGEQRPRVRRHRIRPHFLGGRRGVAALLRNTNSTRATLPRKARNAEVGARHWSVLKEYVSRVGRGAHVLVARPRARRRPEDLVIRRAPRSEMISRTAFSNSLRSSGGPGTPLAHRSRGGTSVTTRLSG